MKKNKPRKMAMQTARHRAIESCQPENERLCFDPYAKYFRKQGRNVRRVGFREAFLRRVLRLVVPGAHEYFSIRSQLVDDYLQDCVGAGIEQLVILGAGYDARAHRYREILTQVGVYEVDDPVTQADKKKKLAGCPLPIADNVTYVALDLGNDLFADKLFDSGYVASVKSLFVMEGISMYLPSQTMDEVLRFVTKHAAQGSSIIFDYTSPAVVEGSSEIEGAKRWQKAAQRQGTALRFGIEEDAIEDYLLGKGFSQVSNYNAVALSHMYFQGVIHNRKLTTLVCIAQATV